MPKIYLDYASTTPADPEVIAAMIPYFQGYFGNASSPHAYGREAQKALEEARERLAEFIGADREEIVFTSGATEANNHAVIGTARASRKKGKHIIVSAIEQHSVLEPAEYLRKNEGFDVTHIKVDQDGLVDPQEIQKAVREDTILVAVMCASNEIGTVQPITEIGALTQKSKVSFLVDAVQAVGHIPIHVKELKADLLSLSAHKFYGPKGVGALFIRKGTEIAPFLLGGDQERGRRASTQNVYGAVGLAKAVELCGQRMKYEAVNQTQLRNRLLAEVPKIISGVKVNGHRTKRLPNNAHFSFENVQGEALLMGLDQADIAVSMGSACTSGALEPSHVLRAIGLSDELAYGALRITLGRWTTGEQIDYFLDQLPGIVKSLRG
jgi:cysteine desulfurase